MYGFETWSVTLWEENRTCLGTESGRRYSRWQETGDRRIMEEMHDLPSLPNTANVMKWGGGGEGGGDM